jgi:hypothetical protein
MNSLSLKFSSRGRRSAELGTLDTLDRQEMGRGWPLDVATQHGGDFLCTVDVAAHRMASSGAGSLFQAPVHVLSIPD